MDKLTIVGGGMIFLIILLGAYFLTRRNGLDHLIGQKDKLEGNLALAQGKLNKEKQTLGAMVKNFQNSSELTISVQDQMKKASDLVKQTDFMFTDPYGSNPKIIIKNLLAYISINDERKNINQLLSEWQQKIGARLAQNINLSESEKIKKDAQTIQTFIKDLSQIVESLTPKNSGLSQFQIDIYTSKLPTQEAINEILVSLGTAIDIENSNSNNLQTSPSSGSNIPSVTPDDLIVQQAVVAEAQTAVVALQEQLAQIEEQVQQSSLAPTPTDTAINSNSETQIENQSAIIESNNYITPPPREPITSQGIIVQPGPPRLIQGTDQY